MTVWFVLALMTAAAIFAVLWPLARQGRNLRSGSDVAVYRDQLDEIDRDRAAGRIADSVATAKQSQSMESLIAQVESHLERNPDDGRGWEVIAPIYLRLGRFEDAVTA